MGTGNFMVCRARVYATFREPRKLAALDLPLVPPVYVARRYDLARAARCEQASRLLRLRRKKFTE